MGIILFFNQYIMTQPGSKVNNLAQEFLLFHPGYRRWRIAVYREDLTTNYNLKYTFILDSRTIGTPVTG